MPSRTVNGTTLNYEEAGHGMPVVLLHGFPLDSRVWAKQIEGLEITYEDYEPGFGTAQGIARTSELTLWAVEKTPSRQAIADFTDAVRTPPMLACAPAHYVAANVFGGFAVTDRMLEMFKPKEGPPGAVVDVKNDGERREVK